MPNEKFIFPGKPSNFSLQKQSVIRQRLSLIRRPPVGQLEECEHISFHPWFVDIKQLCKSME
jgi:hypothetical protein